MSWNDPSTSVNLSSSDGAYWSLFPGVPLSVEAHNVFEQKICSSCQGMPTPANRTQASPSEGSIMPKETDIALFHQEDGNTGADCMHPDLNYVSNSNHDMHIIHIFPAPAVGHLFHLDANLTFICLHDACHKSFESRTKARTHAYGHMNFKPCGCSCGQLFGSKETAIRHRVYATQDETHTCSTCEKKFKRVDHMRKHEKACHAAKALMASVTS